MPLGGAASPRFDSPALLLCATARVCGWAHAQKWGCAFGAGACFPGGRPKAGQARRHGIGAAVAGRAWLRASLRWAACTRLWRRRQQAGLACTGSGPLRPGFCPALQDIAAGRRPKCFLRRCAGGMQAAQGSRCGSGALRLPPRLPGRPPQGWAWCVPCGRLLRCTGPPPPGARAAGDTGFPERAGDKVCRLHSRWPPVRGRPRRALAAGEPAARWPLCEAGPAPCWPLRRRCSPNPGPGRKVCA